MSDNARHLIHLSFLPTQLEWLLANYFLLFHHLEVKISPAAPELKAESGAQVTLVLTVADLKGKGVAAEMAVAVVDEAVLALTGFKTPTLERLTRFDLPLRVFTGELRPLLLHQTPFYPSQIEPLTGGGGMSGEMLTKLLQAFPGGGLF